MEDGESLNMDFMQNNVMLMVLFKVCGIVDSSKEMRLGYIVNNEEQGLVVGDETFSEGRMGSYQETQGFC